MAEPSTAPPVARTGFRFALAGLLLCGSAFFVGFLLPLYFVVPEAFGCAFAAGALGLVLAGWGRAKRPLVALLLGFGALLAAKPFAVPMDCTLIVTSRWCTASDGEHQTYFVAAAVCVALAGLLPLASRLWRRRASRKAERLGEGERIIEMTWRCSSCGHVNLGRHLVCQGCHGRMDGTEKYELPADTSKAATVTEAALVRMALAGPNWRCAYCGSDQREADGRCRGCGADAPKIPAAAGTLLSWSRRALRVAGVLAGAALAAGVAVSTSNRDGPSFQDVQVRLESLSWERTVRVSSRVAIEGSGFAEAQPKDAFDVQPAGTREHHQETVCDESGEERYSEEVPDGTRTERYSERVQCGETCTESRESCREECSGTGTGFAKCKTVCSGGGRHCTPKYCNESRTREVPRTRSVERTRSVCRRSHLEPRSAAWFTWKTWGWKTVRTLRREGTQSEPLAWPPDSEVALADGEQSHRWERLRAVVREGSGAALDLELDEARWRALQPGKAYLVRKRLDGSSFGRIPELIPQTP